MSRLSSQSSHLSLATSGAPWGHTWEGIHSLLGRLGLLTLQERVGSSGGTSLAELGQKGPWLKIHTCRGNWEKQNLQAKRAVWPGPPPVCLSVCLPLPLCPLPYPSLSNTCTSLFPSTLSQLFYLSHTVQKGCPRPCSVTRFQERGP